MKKFAPVFAAILISLFLVVPVRSMGADPPGTGPLQLDAAVYNPQNIMSIKGTVESIGNYPSWGLRSKRGRTFRGVILKTDQGHITVRIGPPLYLKNHGFSPKRGDTLEVTGFKIIQKENIIIMAREVTADGKILKLRDENGFPLWAGAPR